MEYPRGARFANGRCRHSDVWVRLDPHFTRQATKSYVERGDAFGLISHEGLSLTIRSGFLWTDFCAALAAAHPPSSVMNSRRSFDHLVGAGEQA
jgi:hypothetical protein